MRFKFVNSLAARLADSAGKHLANRTRNSDLIDLIRSLHPIDSGVSLVRLGPAGDGGYLIPDDLAGIQYCFSPGVSTESGFEADLADRGVHVFLADFSVDGPAQIHAKFHFEKKFVGCLSNGSYFTLDEWKDSHLRDFREDLILQMDIEGAEFEPS